MKRRVLRRVHLKISSRIKSRNGFNRNRVFNRIRDCGAFSFSQQPGRRRCQHNGQYPLKGRQAIGRRQPGCRSRMIIVAGKALQQNEAVAAIPLKTMVPRRYRHRAKSDRHGCGTAEDRPECLDAAPCFAARQRRARCAIGINATGSKTGVKARACHRSAIVA